MTGIDLIERERNRQIDEGVFAAVADPRRPEAAPSRETVPPFLSFAPLQNGLAALQRGAERYDKALSKASDNGGAALGGAISKGIDPLRHDLVILRSWRNPRRG